MKGVTGGSEPFAETRYLNYRFERESIVTNAPEGSGIYGLYNAVWIFVGEADNVRVRLLEHLAGDNPCINRYGPSGFAFELVPAQARHRRYQEAASRAEPICARKYFASKMRREDADG